MIKFNFFYLTRRSTIPHAVDEGGVIKFGGHKWGQGVGQYLKFRGHGGGYNFSKHVRLIFLNVMKRLNTH